MAADASNDTAHLGLARLDTRRVQGFTVLYGSNCAAAHLHQENWVTMSVRFRYDHWVVEFFVRQKDLLLKPERGR